MLYINEVIVDVDNLPTVKQAAKTYDSKRWIVLPEYIQALINNLPAENGRIITLSGQAIYKRFKCALASNKLLQMSFHDLRHPRVKLGQNIFSPLWRVKTNSIWIQYLAGNNLLPANSYM